MQSPQNSRQPTGTSFYATNLAGQRQVVNLEITQPGNKQYKAFVNGEERAVPHPLARAGPLAAARQRN